jgi:dTDP-4-dehydrorhamnose 3,5-epimerase
MIFKGTPLTGVFQIELEKHEDDRGFFARTYCAEEFARQGLETGFSQCSISCNRHRGTLRGLHYQVAPHEEVKVVRCLRGRVFDVVVDLRPDSVTSGKWFALELSAENGLALYIPRGFAHGFLSLEDDSLLLYQISCPYAPESARTIRWNDPHLNISWPDVGKLVLSDKDRNAPLWSHSRG